MTLLLEKRHWGERFAAGTGPTPLPGKDWLKCGLDCFGKSLCSSHALCLSCLLDLRDGLGFREVYFRLWMPGVKAQISALSAQLPWKTSWTNSSAHSCPDRAPEVFLLPSTSGRYCLFVRVSYDTETYWSLGQRQFQMRRDGERRKTVCPDGLRAQLLSSGGHC